MKSLDSRSSMIGEAPTFAQIGQGIYGAQVVRRLFNAKERLKGSKWGPEGAGPWGRSQGWSWGGSSSSRRSLLYRCAGFLDPRARPTCSTHVLYSKTDPGRWGWGRGNLSGLRARFVEFHRTPTPAANPRCLVRRDMCPNNPRVGQPRPTRYSNTCSNQTRP